MQTLGTSKSIPTSILKKIKNKISILLVAIINNSFEHGIFYNLLKSAKVFKNKSTDQSLFSPT